MNVKSPYKISGHRFSGAVADTKAICLALSRVATEHGGHLGILKGFDPARDCGWVILSMRLRVLKRLDPAHAVELETWVAAIEGASLVREYRISRERDDGSREILVEAAQSFVLFDRDSRRPVLPPLERREELKGLGRTLDFPFAIKRRAIAGEIPDHAPCAVSSHLVTDVDVDLNGHLNNAQYVAWVPDLTDPVGEIAIEYLREAKLGDRLIISTWAVDQTSTYSFNFESADSSVAPLTSALVKKRPAFGHS